MFLRQVLPPVILNFLLRLKNAGTNTEENTYLEQREIEKIKGLPRFTNAEIVFCGHTLKIVDNASFFFIQKELFDSKIYEFKSTSISPYILDCGANIGLSVIYFKTLFPDAEIVAFEPDKKVFDVLQYNIKSFALANVTLIEKACWYEEGELSFFNEGADGGRAARGLDEKNITKVETVRLRDFLVRKVDFLKIDIEGAEWKVLEDCGTQLHYVENIFVEYHSFLKAEQHLPEILSVLKDAGFRLHINAPGLTSLQPFVDISTYSGMDNQLNIYGFR